MMSELSVEIFGLRRLDRDHHQRNDHWCSWVHSKRILQKLLFSRLLWCFVVEQEEPSSCWSLNGRDNSLGRCRSPTYLIRVLNGFSFCLGSGMAQGFISIVRQAITAHCQHPPWLFRRWSIHDWNIPWSCRCFWSSVSSLTTDSSRSLLLLNVQLSFCRRWSDAKRAVSLRWTRTELTRRCCLIGSSLDQIVQTLSSG